MSPRTRSLSTLKGPARRDGQAHASAAGEAGSTPVAGADPPAGFATVGAEGGRLRVMSRLGMGTVGEQLSMARVNRDSWRAVSPRGLAAWPAGFRPRGSL